MSQGFPGRLIGQPSDLANRSVIKAFEKRGLVSVEKERGFGSGSQTFFSECRESGSPYGLPVLVRTPNKILREAPHVSGSRPC